MVVVFFSMETDSMSSTSSAVRLNLMVSTGSNRILWLFNRVSNRMDSEAVLLFLAPISNGFRSLLFERCGYHFQYMILYLACLIICYRKKLRDPSSRFLLISSSRNLRKGSETFVQMKDLCCDNLRLFFEHRF